MNIWDEMRRERRQDAIGAVVLGSLIGLPMVAGLFFGVAGVAVVFVVILGGIGLTALLH